MQKGHFLCARAKKETHNCAFNELYFAFVCPKEKKRAAAID